MSIGNVLTAAMITGANVARTLAAPTRLPTSVTAEERAVAARLRQHVSHLAGEIGPRNLYHPNTLDLAAAYIEDQFARAGFRPRRQVYVAEGQKVANVEAELAGADGQVGIAVVGAHYDSVGDSPGANDNATGVAVLIELARMLLTQQQPRITLRLVAFVNEEPPHFMTGTMGSFVYAQAAVSRREPIKAMISLETLGYFSDAPGSQRYPKPFDLLFPNRGNFVAMVSNVRSARLLAAVQRGFRSATSLPAVASPAPERIPGIAWSDHWSFWQHGIPAVMLTDTAPFRYPYYHTQQDTPDKVDYDRLAQVVTGCVGGLNEVSRGER